ncbi:AidA/PixA family protein [Xenorhabdus lircayensis]|uniref:Inclusion body protein n=1 Tax=Xenorhabdus lircayensis TaxID=2763499 RepID=A0ABS0U857_9GAMM|nr:AidA/PixA family protein [Xenorhabdus lircayensis]MBI6550062.1 inclusion body protein [Xenorhabdus lircayensis]
MKNIDIMLAIKAEEIMNDYGKLSKDINKPVTLHPSTLYSRYIRVLPEDDKIVTVDDELNITVKANIGDLVRWNVMTLNIDSIYSAAVMRMSPMDMKLMAMRSMKDDVVTMMDPPIVEHVMRFMPKINMAGSLNVDIQEMEDYHWMTKINDLPCVGTERTMFYECVIAIFRETTLMGYISMEPGIILNNKMIIS